MDKNSAKELFQKIPPHLIVLGVLGLIFVVIGNPFGHDDDPEDRREVLEQHEQQSQADTSRNSEALQYKKQMEKDLQTILSQTAGVGDVNVMINLTGGKELDIAKNIEEEIITTNEQDGQQGERMIEEQMTSEEILTVREQGTEQPMVLRELKPEITGIVIVAEGAHNIQVKKNLMRAVDTLFNIPEHRVDVLPKNN